jgi:transcriptional regulator with XRE-family HTH domain
VPVRKKQAWRSDARASRAVDASLRRLGRSLRTYRVARDMTQEEVAERAHIDPKHYQAMESGLSNVTFATLLAVSKALDVSLSELFTGV